MLTLLPDFFSQIGLNREVKVVKSRMLSQQLLLSEAILRIENSVMFVPRPSEQLRTCCNLRR